MYNWLLFVIIGQFLNAVVVFIDRQIVATRTVSKPIVYTFYVGLLSGFVIVLLPLGGVEIPTPETIILSLLGAVAFVVSILFLYESFLWSDPSELMPVVGGSAALTTFILSSVALGEKLPNHFIAGFFILILGMTLFSHFKFTHKSFFYIVSSGFFFGFSLITMKMLFRYEDFLNGFFWSRMANVFVVLLLLLWPGVYKLIRDDFGQSPKYKRKLVVGNKILAGIAFIFILLALKYGDVSIVNALAALQYLFLFLFAVLWSRKFPEYFSGRQHQHEFLHKTAATLLIVIGFFVLFI